MDPDLRLHVLNAILVTAVGVTGLGVLVAEGYLSRLPAPFVILVGVTLVLAAWGAARVGRRRLLVLMALAGVGGIVTQLVGTRIGAWSYPRPTFFFVAFAFAVGSVCVYTLASLLPRVRGVPLALLPVAALAISGIRDPAFVAWYGFLVLVVVLLRVREGLPIVLAAVVFGAFAEWAGQGLWVFPDGPPAWLVLGSWPLESLVHVGLSARLTREPVFSPAGASSTADRAGAGATP